MPSESQRKSLPFEPKRNRSKTEKRSQAAQTSSPKAPAKPKGDSKAKSSKTSPAKAKPSKAKANDAGSVKTSSSASREKTQIPEAVSRRMVRRMAFFCGIPTFLGMSSFVVSYFIVKSEVFPLPHIAVVLVSMAFFGMGVVGLSYGALSASWDEEQAGSLLGFSEFGTNLGRMTQAWRSARKQS